MITKQIFKNTIRLTEKDEDELIKIYQTPYPKWKVAELMGVSENTVTNVLIRRNIKRRDNRKYYCNFDFFEKIDTEEKAYWLGFIVGDGNVHKDVLHIGVHVDDYDFLCLFNKAISGNHPVVKKTYISKGKPSQIARIDVVSRKMMADLFDKGVIPNKTGRMDMNLTLSKVPKKLQKHFIRGFFDADGSFSLVDRNDKMTFKLGGKGIGFLDPVQKIMVEEANLSLNKLYGAKQCKDFYTLAWGGTNHLYKIYLYFYKDTNVFLDRKKIKLEGYLSRREIPLL